jgi:hypothetical protein
VALKDYKVSYEDGTETYFQFDDSDEVGKQQLQTFKDAAENSDSPVKSVTQSSPEPFNASSKKGGGGGT